MTRESERRTGLVAGDRRRFIAPLLAVLLLSISAIGLGLHRRAAAQEEQHAADNATFLVLQTRAEMSWLHLDLLITGLDAELAGTEPTEEDLRVFNRRRGMAISRLAEVVDTDSVTGVNAADLVAMYRENVSLYDAGWPYDAQALDYDHYTGAESRLGFAASRTERIIEESIAASLLPRLVALDGLALELDDRDEAVPDWAWGYVTNTADVVRSTPGWLGPDRADPLADNYVGVGRFPADVATLPGFAELQRLWDYDNWLLGYFDGGPTGPPPLAGDQFRSTSRAASVGIDGAVRQQLDEAIGELPSGPISATGWLLVSAVTGLGALVIGAATMVRRIRRHHSLADAVYTDSLTGVRNRRYLIDEERGRCRRRNTHHVVAMIDLDRFKMVNDTWGHDVGDAILVTAANRLLAVVDAVTRPWAQADGSVVRLGGDEFVVVLHCPDRFNRAVLEAGIRGVAGRVDVGLEEPVPLELSVGFAESFEPAELDDLLKSADLEVYRDKRGSVHPADGIQVIEPPSLR
ncbi:MAG: GGDEF domain-containing protein [Actinomycetota bacterium]